MTTANWQPTGVERALGPPIPALNVLQPSAMPVAYVPRNVPPRALAGAVPRVQGVYKVGKPYTIAGVNYIPAEDPRYDRVGRASWYGPDFHAKRTANGEVFDMNAISAAHPTLPMPSYAYVTNLRNGRTVLVRINDRGPYKPGRIIDLSHYTAQLLGFQQQGTTEIRVKYAGPAPLDPRDDRRERQHLAAQIWNQTERAGITAGTNWGRPRYGLGMANVAASHE